MSPLDRLFTLGTALVNDRAKTFEDRARELLGVGDVGIDSLVGLWHG
jgi:hypothetical protein